MISKTILCVLFVLCENGVLLQKIDGASSKKQTSTISIVLPVDMRQIVRIDLDDRPIWSNSEASTREEVVKRISDRKCEEYSRAVSATDNKETPLCNYALSQRIVGGDDVIPGEFPHVAAIGWENTNGGYTFNCAGSLISPRFVLTVAHCTKVPQTEHPAPTVVRLGDHNLNSSVDDGLTPLEVQIKAIHKHPNYSPPKVYNDIALLELAADVTFNSNVRPACLWTKDNFGGHDRAVATGWGVVDRVSREKPEELKKVSLTLVDNLNCDRLLLTTRNRNWQGVATTQLCAGELDGGKGTCQGDSGAPLQVTSVYDQCIYHVMGLTSFGHKCAVSNTPTIFTRVSSYLDWIESIVWPEN